MTHHINTEIIPLCRRFYVVTIIITVSSWRFRTVLSVQFRSVGLYTPWD